MSVNRWLAGAGLMVLAAAAGGCGAGTTPDASGTPAPTSTAAAPAETSTSPSTPAATATPAVLSGTRQVTIVRVDAFESGVSLSDEGRLTEAVGDSGRQLFVPTPLDGGLYLIKAYYGSSHGSGPGEAVCWQVRNPRNTQPLSVEGAACKQNEPGQQFEITTTGGGDTPTFQISNRGALLRGSAQHGLILEELGDAPPADGFRLVDNGPAPAGG
ncbi:hypothetical protein [Polymorphospora lycopeni]|uniref:Uncharacterized protein n=1 Tax=Polymorphospora lycopeni TaxID=3140240 RepID=A0ABV5CJZ3_9ACTN